MGKVRLVLGRSGSGKTDYCINEFVRCLRENRRPDGRTDAFLIVPEQFAVDYERKVLNHPECTGLLGSEVISFNRLAHRIMSESGELEKSPISPSGKAMILVCLMKDLESKGLLSFYKQCAGSAKSIAGLLETMSELSKYCVSPSVLEKAAERSSANDALKAKFSELALIYSEFERRVGEKYTDGAFLMKSAAFAVKNHSTEASCAVLWIDGFSGFTEAEMILVNAFADTCPEVNICLFYDGDKNLIFNCPNETVLQLRKRFNALGHTVEIVDVSAVSKAGRFQNSAALGFLEERYGRLTKAQSNAPDAIDTIKIYNCTDAYQEVENCAEEIKKLVASGYEFNEIAIVSSGLDDKAAIFRAIFSRLSIPYFLDNKRELSGHPVVRFVLSMLEIISRGMTCANVFEMLKTGLFKSDIYDTSCIDTLENKTLSLGVNSARSWEKMCRRFNGKYAGAEPQNIPSYVCLANDIYNIIYGLGGFSEKLKNCKTVKDCARILLEFAEISGLEKSVEYTAKMLTERGMEDVSDTYLRIWNVFTEVTQQAASIVGEVKIQGYRKLCDFYGDILRVALGAYKIGFIPYTSKAVQIGNADRSRYLDKKVIFVIGANEGQFPAKFSESGVLGDLERELLKDCGASLAYDSLERTYFAQFNVYSVLVSASEKLYLSYSNYDTAGGELFPAPCIAAVKEIFKDIKTETISPKAFEGELANLREENLTVNIDRELAKKLLKIGAECKMSVSGLEDYRGCPYKFFLSRCLRLSERDLGQVKANTIGTYFHGLIELATKDERFKPGVIDRGVLKNLVLEAASEFLSDPENDALRYLFENSAKNTFLKSRIDDFAQKDVAVIADVSALTGFYPAENELKFGMDGEKSIPAVKIPCDEVDLLLRGIIDRVDFRDNDGKREVVVVDHKSSAQDFNRSKVEQGTKLQLLTYLYAVSENEDYFKRGENVDILPSAVLYYVFGKDTGTYSDGGNKAHKYSGFANDETFPKEVLSDKNSPLTGVSVEDLDGLKEIAVENIKREFERIRSGAFDVSPDKSADPCKYCSGKGFCGKENG